MYANFPRSLTAVIFTHVFASSLILIFVALYEAECYAALPFVHLLMEITCLPISRLATFFMHGLNTVYFCSFGYGILCFRFTILSVQPLLTAPFFGRCVQCTRYQ